MMMLRGALLRRRALLVSRRGACAQQGDWDSGSMAERYAANRGTFQDSYARDCWQRMSSRDPEVLKRAERIVDVGCGTGDFTAELAQMTGKEVVGVDLSTDMVSHARSRYSTCAFEQIDLASQAWSGQKFDIATSTMALHWPGANVAFLRGVKSMLKDGGLFLAGFHTAGSVQEGVDAVEATMRLDKFRKYFPEGRALDDFPTMFRRQAPEVWERALKEAGFVDLKLPMHTIRTPYFSKEAYYSRLIAAWPPILAPNYLPSPDVVADFIDHAADHALQARRIKYSHSFSDNDDPSVVAYMTSYLLEFSASLPYEK